MIIDCHAHIFAHWIGACGHPSREVHKRYLQRVVTRTVAPTYRLRDGALADTKALFKAGDESWDGLADVDFRVGRFGRRGPQIAREGCCHRRRRRRAYQAPRRPVRGSTLTPARTW